MLSSTWHQRRVDNSREGQYKGGGGRTYGQSQSLAHAIFYMAPAKGGQQQRGLVQGWWWSDLRLGLEPCSCYLVHGTNEGWTTVERVNTRVVVVELTVRARALLMLSSTWHQRRVDNSREGQYKGGGGRTYGQGQSLAHAIFYMAPAKGGQQQRGSVQG